jgi:hypothetical protein
MDRFPLLTPVADVEDIDATDPALIIFDHYSLGGEADLYSIQRASDNHMSLRTHKELRQISALAFLKKWAKGMKYPE